MFQLIDLGGCPANEDCAQLGQTENFDLINHLEVECYRAALQAKFGPPPEGCQLVISSNFHDFGPYKTLAIKVWNSVGDSQAVSAYLYAAGEGLGSWIEAGFRAPVEYTGSKPVPGSLRDFEACIVSALMITRPGPDGRFPVSDFAVLHGHLAAIYPDCAALALRQMGGQAL